MASDIKNGKTSLSIILSHVNFLSPQLTLVTIFYGFQIYIGGMGSNCRFFPLTYAHRRFNSAAVCDDSGPLVQRSAIPKIHYSETCVPKLVYKLAEACYISVAGTNPNHKPKRPTTPPDPKRSMKRRQLYQRTHRTFGMMMD